MLMLMSLTHSASNALGAPSTAETDGLQQATEAGDAEIWIAQTVAECVPDGRTNHGERTTAVRVELFSRQELGCRKLVLEMR